MTTNTVEAASTRLYRVCCYSVSDIDAFDVSAYGYDSAYCLVAWYERELAIVSPLLVILVFYSKTHSRHELAPMVM